LRRRDTGVGYVGACKDAIGGKDGKVYGKKPDRSSGRDLLLMTA